MEFTEALAMIGFPVRLVGRMPIVFRYVPGDPRKLLTSGQYAHERWGTSFKFRPWLRMDAAELEQIERLINYGTDEEVLEYRQSQLASGATTTVVGSLLAASCATMLQLDSLSEINLTVRGLFTISLMISLMSVYFTLVQQRELSLPTTPATLRVWLWNGRTTVRHKLPNRTQKADVSDAAPLHTVRESSLTANILLQAPFELLGIAISMFLAGLAAYLGLAMQQHLKLSTGKSPTNAGFFGAFLVCTVFTLAVFGRTLGEKDRERIECGRKLAGATEDAEAMDQPPMADWATRSL